ncbi:hypothetical protein [Alteromonas flava]|uniref:hypothetical protein n=1 Tax=Alteromonas flava TaxID=2048003 RepID=UPI000C2928ED|nr:hypothetical protein [Alteromonas flava]
MNKDEIEAKALYDDIQKKEALLNQFEKLKPSIKETLLRNLGFIAVFAFLLWMFPELFEQPVLYALLLMIVAVSAETHIESKRIHDRIDILQRLMKQ